ncbi:hypothetical protein B0S90_0111 [Caldicellulosiruptor bescii]|uniref:Transport protein n=2 Tax=Caldicellulosiruptor bescii TaxID=31899 RepID=B9MPQ3_CALBD|nr:DUF554 domain-containing protein [Caldicellulosiruptor bescii]ACM61686.1 protein of unknown function DUF554 [Caldicellulosiruptor bescii DSM 6725]PBC88510.1 hypothetical protein B0S87_1513 [Caldicellulosiruptor bescii]PBC92008.1 hypothetical protein B0S89_2479 [Caldicellulosiruptor bescii]PBD02579.1 hypothetical protein B0S85_0095 [Caldicellulosiruptor bescii]PBD05187.1 hypothetical protein B0S90_0111 [Caldicellulosiruptor bescii]
MIGLGTIVNAAAVIVGSILGLVLKFGIPERFKSTIMQAISLSVIFIGTSGVLQGIFKVLNSGRIDRQYIMLMIFSLVIGGLVGEILKIEDFLDRLGERIKKIVSKVIKSENSTFTEGFVTASLVFCVGAMAIVGSLEDGLNRNFSILFAKSILDGVTSVIFSATLGIGVMFSSVVVLLYQGSITLLAGLLKPLLTDTVVLQMSMVGSVLIFAIGLNMLGVSKIKVGNLLPAIFVPAVWYVVNLLI